MLNATVNLYFTAVSVIVFTAMLTSMHPHQNVSSVLHLQAKLIYTTLLIVSVPQRSLSHFGSQLKTLTGSWKPWGNWVTEEWKTDWWLMGSWSASYKSNCVLPQQNKFRELEILFLSNCSQSTVHILPRLYFLPFQTFNLIIITTFVAVIPKLFGNTYMESTSWKTLSLWGNTNVELATCAQSIDHLLVTIADDIPQQSLFFLIQRWR